MAASAVTRRRSIMPRQARGRRLRREMSSRDARALAVVGPPLLHARLLLQAKPFEECVDQSRPDLAGQVYGKGFARGAWTYESNLPCYDGLGVEGGIARAKAEMGQALRAAFRAPHSSVGRRLSLAATAALRQ